MKGIILEKKDEYAVVLTKQCDYKKIYIGNKDHLLVGEEIQLPYFNLNMRMPKIDLSLRRLKYAASLLIIALLFIPINFIYQYNSVAGYINIDINPSIEFAYNNQERVIDVTALNEDALNLLGDISLKNKTIEEAIMEYMNLASNYGYFQGQADKGIVISLTNITKGLKIENIEALMSKLIIDKESLAIQYMVNDKETFLRAKEQHQSPGMMLMIESIKGDSGELRSLSTYELIHEYKTILIEDAQIPEQNMEQNKEQNKEQNIVQNMEQNMDENMALIREQKMYKELNPTNNQYTERNRVNALTTQEAEKKLNEFMNWYMIRLMNEKELEEQLQQKQGENKDCPCYLNNNNQSGIENGSSTNNQNQGGINQGTSSQDVTNNQSPQEGTDPVNNQEQVNNPGVGENNGMENSDVNPNDGNLGKDKTINPMPNDDQPKDIDTPMDNEFGAQRPKSISTPSKKLFK